MASTFWYKEWFNSPFYHKLYFERDEKEASAFITRLIRHLQPAKDSRMLDVACGRGRHSKILAEMGFTVTGIDISFANIGAALKSALPNLDFFVHDMRLPFWINYYDFAFNFFTSFGYFTTRREHDDTIRTIANSLRTGGQLVIDYLNVHYAEEHLVYDEEKKLGETTYTIQRWDDETHFHKKITVSDPSLAKSLEYTEKVAKFTLGDFTDMLAYQGMQVQEVFGDYSFSAYNVRETPRLILIARKGFTDKDDKKKRLYSDGRTTDALT